MHIFSTVSRGMWFSDPILLGLVVDFTSLGAFPHSAFNFFKLFMMRLVLLWTEGLVMMI